MANKKSARKRAVKSLELKQKNRAARSRMRSAVKAARQSIAQGGEATAAAVARAVAVIDATAQKGVVHRNTAARSKSRLMRAANAAKG
ncbi:MAG TPA: 30S ribosomal protein S20 [Thermoanaerobaculia bacterium]|jgi:small subunit ribosomal protein S20